tara:strand:- start:2190 stop:2780 length:591 start_codon:yes stop_codon:yes gene_type:complete
MKFNPKRTKFRMGPVKTGRSKVKKEHSLLSEEISGPVKFYKEEEIPVPPPDEPLHEVCRRLRKAGLKREFQYGDRFYLAEDKEFNSVDSEWCVYPNEDTTKGFPDLVISCRERGVWLPRVEEAFQIMANDHEYFPMACSQERSQGNIMVSFVKLKLRPSVKLLGYVRQDCYSYLIAVLTCLEKVITGNVKKSYGFE